MVFQITFVANQNDIWFFAVCVRLQIGFKLNAQLKITSFSSIVPSTAPSNRQSQEMTVRWLNRKLAKIQLRRDRMRLSSCETYSVKCKTNVEITYFAQKRPLPLS